VIDQTFNAGVKLEFIRVTSSQFQYLYKDATSYIFMDNQTFNQVEVSELMMQDGHKYIKEGENIDLVFDGDDIININLPAKVILKVTQTDPGHRGNTATNATKPAKMETGLELQVPLFINEGDSLKIDTKSGTYSERVKQ
jgi:elongation factor P